MDRNKANEEKEIIMSMITVQTTYDNQGYETFYVLLQPQAEDKLVLYGEALPMIGSRTSEVILFSSQDIDQRKMEQKNQESLTISNVNQEIVKTNNVSKAELIFSIRTGIKVSDWFWLVLVGFLIIGGIVVSFKRKS